MIPQVGLACDCGTQAVNKGFVSVTLRRSADIASMLIIGYEWSMKLLP